MILAHHMKHPLSLILQENVLRKIEHITVLLTNESKSVANNGKAEYKNSQEWLRGQL